MKSFEQDELCDYFYYCPVQMMDFYNTNFLGCRRLHLYIHSKEPVDFTNGFLLDTVDKYCNSVFGDVNCKLFTNAFYLMVDTTWLKSLNYSSNFCKMETIMRYG